MFEKLQSFIIWATKLLKQTLIYMYSLFHGFWQGFVTIGSCNHLIRITSTMSATQRKVRSREDDNYSNWAIISYGVYKGLSYFLLVANNETIHSPTSRIVINDLKQTDTAAERRRSHSNLHSIKVIRFDPLAPVKTTVLLLPIEWKMPDFINNIE